MDATDIPYSSPDDGTNALGPTQATPIAGDTKDDDGAIFDAALKAAPNGIESYPELVEFAVDNDADIPHDSSDGEPPVDWDHINVKRTTRIISGKLPLAGGGSPIMVLPADPNRLWLRFYAEADVKWSDELSTALFAGTHRSTDQPVDNLPHTGALYISPLVEDGTKYVHFWAVSVNG